MIHSFDFECRCGHVHRVLINDGGHGGAINIETRAADCCQHRSDADPAAPTVVDPEAVTAAVDAADVEAAQQAAAAGVDFDIVPCATCHDVAVCAPGRLLDCRAHQAWRLRRGLPAPLDVQCVGHVGDGEGRRCPRDGITRDDGRRWCDDCDAQRRAALRAGPVVPR